MKSAREVLQESLVLRPGDIIFIELPYENATESDFFPLSLNMRKPFKPGHTSLWVDGERPLAHAVRSGYKFPGLRLTKLIESTGAVFRLSDETLATRTSEILKNWSLASKFYSLTEYEKTYPSTYWGERRQKDIRNFYADKDAVVVGPATPFFEPRATHDVLDVARNPELARMGAEGLRRAIKFASRIKLSSPNPVSKGQRCTGIITAAVQAAVLEPIVKPVLTLTSFKQYKGKPFFEYADEVLVEGWRDTELGKRLIEAVEKNDYSIVFPKAFARDQRYALPEALFTDLLVDPAINQVGFFASFGERLDVLSGKFYQVRIGAAGVMSFEVEAGKKKSKSPIPPKK